MEAIYNNIASTSESGHMQRLIQMTELVNAYTELKQLVIFSQDGINPAVPQSPGQWARRYL